MAQRKGRTAQLTITELFASPRFQIALDLFPSDPQFMRAILTELVMETTMVVKSALIKRYSCASSMSAFELIPYLRATDDFSTYNLWWSMTPEEIQLFSADPKHKLSKEEKAELLEFIRKRMMES